MKQRLECFVVSNGTAEGDLRAGDHVLVDWSRRPEIGVLYAVREGDHAVRIARFRGEELAGETGRLVNPARLLKVCALGAQP